MQWRELIVIFEILSYIDKISQAAESKTLRDGYGDIAEAATFLVDQCAGPPPKLRLVAGQVFMTSDWNVIVTWDDEYCWTEQDIVDGSNIGFAVE